MNYPEIFFFILCICIESYINIIYFLYITHLRTTYDLLIRHYFRRILKEPGIQIDPNLFRAPKDGINARKAQTYAKYVLLIQSQILYFLWILSIILFSI